MKVKKNFKILILFTLMIIFTSCEKKNSSPTTTLRLLFLNDVNSLDPRFGYEIPANHAIKMLFEGLLRHDPSGNLRPGVAERYAVSPDGKKYTFFLRHSTWSTGQPVTAHDFVYSWKGIIDPQLPTQGSADFYPIKQVEAVIKGEASLDEVGVRALDTYTLEVELEYPTPYFLDLITTAPFSPVSIENEKATNGPFKLKEHLPNHRLVLEKNNTYWDASHIQLEQIEISIIEDVQTQLALFEKGDADWFGKPFAKLPLDAVPALYQRQKLQTFPEKAVYWYFLNTQKFPFNEVKFRKAFAYAMNRKILVSHLLQEREEEALSVNRGHSYFRDGDVEKANLLFEEALEAHQLTRETFPPIKLSYCGIETNHKIASVVQQQWQDALGIVVELDPQEWTTYYDNLANGNFLIGGLSWHSRITDPIYNLQLFTYESDRLNMSNWEHPHFQELMGQAQREQDPTKRLAFLEEAEALLMEEMPIIPIYFLSVSYAKNPALKGVYISDINEIDLTRAYR